MPEEKSFSIVSLEDIAGLSAPLTKLVKVIAAGMGNLYRPIGIVREANANAASIRALTSADADAIRSIAVAQADAERELEKASRERRLNEIEFVAEIGRRAELRVTAEHLVEQENLERIAANATRYIGEAVSNEDVSSDWRTLFFRSARDISDETMREVWGRVLAGEVTQPGSYSLRTLEVLRLMSRAEAEAFARFCNLVFEPDFVVRMDSGLDAYGLTFNDILALQGAGVVRESLSLSKKFPKDGVAPQGRCLLVTHDRGLQLVLQRRVEASVYMLTRVGRELRRLVVSQANMAYVDAVQRDLTVPGCTVLPIRIEREGEMIRVEGRLVAPDAL